MKKGFKKALIMMLSIVMVFSCMTVPAAADDTAPTASLDRVLEEIGEISNEPADYTSADRERIEAIQADYEALSAVDQATVDSTFNHPTGDGQSYGRILQAALWAVRSFGTDNSTTLANGTYTMTTDPAVASESDKGKSDSSRTRNWWVESVSVENGEATAYIYVTSGAATAKKLTSYPSIWYAGKTVERNSDNNYPLPVDLNGTTYFGGVSDSMPRPIMYALSTTITEPEEVEPEPVALTITNNTGMFKAATATAVMNEDGTATLTMALSGSGYHYLFKGTYEEAASNGSNTENWITGTQNAEGKWEFVITIEAEELGKEVPIVAISQSYYDKYIAGENSIERAFYPRQFTLDMNEATLVTDDYKSTKDIAVTNNIKMFKPGETAEMECIGGPNSNNYKADLVLPMGSDSMSEVFVGDYAEAAAATETIAFDAEAMTFTIPVKWVETFGQPETLVNLANGEPFHICFKSKKNGTWYERKATLDEETGTLVFDPADADYTAVTAAQEAAAAIDREKYTEESLAVLDAAVAAVETGKFESQQAEVDAMAKAINDAIAALEEKNPEPQPIELTIVNNTGMFKAVTATAVMNEDGSATLTMALSGSGYHNLYKGTYEQAVANGDKTENWIAGTQNAAGKWEFVITIEAEELGKEVPIVAISQSYYDKYIAGENSIERAFYPRQFTLDMNEATLVTDDYKSTKDIAVTNNIKMFKPGAAAEMECVGGPNSNNYKADLILPMQSDSMSNVFIGSYAEAEAASETIAFDAEKMTFTIPVKWVETFGQPETLVTLADGEAFYISFKSAKNGTWYERKATLSEEAGTLVFDPSDADYTAVTAAQEAATAVDRDKYTEESLAVLDEAVAAVVTGKFESQQAEVDAMAKAINDAIEALVEKGSEGGEGDVARVFGKNRYETSLKAADALLELNGEGKFDAVILASGEDYPDALAGSHLSCVFNCPILLVDKNDSRIAAVQDFIKENLKEGGTVYILGGTGVVPDKAAEGLDGYEPVRLGGANRYLTNIQILDTGLKADTTADEILVCTGMDFADSLSASAAGKPILLVGKALTQDQKDFLDDLEGDFKFTAIGGTGAVSEAVMKELEAYGTTDRVGGKNRFETSVEVAKKFYESAGSAVIAYAFDFPDGLCGGALAYSMKAPLVITNDGSIAVSAAYAEEQSIKKGVVLGGPTLISDASVRTFFRMGEDDEIIVR